MIITPVSFSFDSLKQMQCFVSVFGAINKLQNTLNFSVVIRLMINEGISDNIIKHKYPYGCYVSVYCLAIHNSVLVPEMFMLAITDEM